MRNLNSKPNFEHGSKEYNTHFENGYFQLLII